MRTISPALTRPIMIVGGIVGTALVFALLVLVFTSWKSLLLVDPVRNHVHYLGQIYETAHQAQELLFRHISSQPPPTEAEVEAVRAKLADLIEKDHNLDPGTGPGLTNARNALGAFSSQPGAALVAALSEIREILKNESAAEANLIDQMHENARWEQRIAIATLIGLPLLAGLTFIILRGRILSSLNRLSELLERLGNRDYAPAFINTSDGDLQPVLESYNALVNRLAVAEAENTRRRDELEAQVRAATRTVLQQGRALAEADRLASVGETSARIAHELRNPLAGIELGLRNLRIDCEDADACPDQSLHDRLDPMIGELQRMSRLLTSLLEQGRRMPEPPAKINLAACVHETAMLARYQTPDAITITTSVGEGLDCLMPRDTLRQVIFNLVLNAVQAVGEMTGTIEIKAEKEGEHLIIQIIDNGPGFPSEILELGPRTFLTRRPGGTGLGLTTVRRLVTEMGGEMALANRADYGAIVQLRLPCRIAHA